MTAAIDTVDPFAGAGGWSVATAVLGLREVGIELDPHACATRAAAGHLTVRADVAAMPTHRMAGKIRGLIASPPCGTFSAAGKGEGVGDLPLLHQCLDDLAAGRDTRAQLAAACSDPRTPLVVEPLRYALDLRPEWIALEQVPAVLPLWEHIARILRTRGYSAWTGTLNAADYGVIAACPLHATQYPTASASTAASHSQYATALGIAEALATTWPDEALAPLAATVADLLVNQIRPAFAGSATCAERERILGALAESVARTTPIGAEGATWTIEATSMCAPTAAIAESIALLLSSCLADPSLAKKWSTISTGTRQTIVRRTWRCIAATLITGCGTGPATRAAGCGLCVDIAVPQTRKRAILIASRVRTVAPPEPTHARAAEPPSLFGAGRQQWVSMAEALGWGMTERPYFALATAGGKRGGADEQVGGSGARRSLYAERDRGAWTVRTNSGNGYAHDYERSADEPCPSVTSRADRWRVDVGAGGFARGYERDCADPSPTIRQQAQSWVLRSNTQDNAAVRTLDEPASTLFFGARGNDVSWVRDRPATTVAGTDRIAKPGHRDRKGGEAQFKDAVRISIQEAAVLQSFPADYPWQGTKTQAFMQVGNAVPPLLALHVLSAATGIAIAEHAGGSAA